MLTADIPISKVCYTGYLRGGLESEEMLKATG